MGLSANIEWLAKAEVLYDGLSREEIRERITEFRASFRPGRVNPITNSGVRLGMTEREVVSRLGKPQKAIWSKKYDARELIYSRETRKDKDGVSVRYTNYYLFSNGRLAMIELDRSTIGGG